MLAVLVLLLLSPSTTGGQVDEVRPGLPALWDELQGLNELVLSLRAEEVERRLALRSLESRLRDREDEAGRQARGLEALRREVEQVEERGRGEANRVNGVNGSRAAEVLFTPDFTCLLPQLERPSRRST